jgi:hypothetical protein
VRFELQERAGFFEFGLSGDVEQDGEHEVGGVAAAELGADRLTGDVITAGAGGSGGALGIPLGRRRSRQVGCGPPPLGRRTVRRGVRRRL